jgi:hypothetical protein
MEVNDQLHAPAVLLSDKETLIPLDRRLGSSETGSGGTSGDRTPIVQPIASLLY